MELLGGFLLPLYRMLVYPWVTPSIKIADTHFYSPGGEKHFVRVKCLSQEHKWSQCPQPGLKPGFLNPNSSALTMRQQRLHYCTMCWELNSRQNSQFRLFIIAMDDFNKVHPVHDFNLKSISWSQQSLFLSLTSSICHGKSKTKNRKTQECHLVLPGNKCV